MGLSVGIQLYNDRWVGAPLCAALTIIRKVFELARTCERFSSSSSQSRVRRFLVILRLAVRLKWWDANTFTSSCMPGPQKACRSLYGVRSSEPVPFSVAGIIVMIHG